MAEKTPPGETTTPRGRWLTFLIFGVLVLTGVLLLWFYMQSSPEAAEPPGSGPVPTENVRHVLPEVPRHLASSRHA